MKVQELINVKRKERIEMLNNELERIREELISLGAVKIILFGSAVRNELGIFSDLDIIAVMKSDLSFIDRVKHVYEIIKPRSADILVYTPEELKEERPFITNALKGSRVIYEKEP